METVQVRSTRQVDDTRTAISRLTQIDVSQMHCYYYKYSIHIIFIEIRNIFRASLRQSFLPKLLHLSLLFKSLGVMCVFARMQKLLSAQCIACFILVFFSFVNHFCR